MVFFKTRPCMKRNNAEVTIVSSFTSHLMCSTHFTLSCRIFSFSLPTTNNFFKFEYSEYTGESAWGVLFRPPWWCMLLWQLKVIRIGITFQPLAGSSCTLLFCLYLVSWIQKKNVLTRAQLSRYSTAFFDHFSFPQNWVITEVLVCPVYAQHALYRRLGGPQSQSTQVRNISPPQEF